MKSIISKIQSNKSQNGIDFGNYKVKFVKFDGATLYCTLTVDTLE